MKALARPRKQTVDYFPHFITSTSRTIFILENAYGNDGYAFWFKLLEMLGSTKGHCIDVNHCTDLEFLAAKAKVTTEKAIEILDKLASVEAIDEELWVNCKIIWCQNFIDNLSDLYTKRKVPLPTKPDIESFLSENSSDEEFPMAETPKLNKSKSNKTKLHKTKQEEVLVVGVDENIPKVVAAYENEIGMITATIYDSIKFYIEQGVQPELIIKSIQIAVKNNKRRFSYCEGILNNWMKEGIKTLRQYELQEKPDTKGKSQTSNEPTTDEMKEFLEEG